jgi:hypothetical protein
VRHDTVAHVLAGGLGIWAEGCPPCAIKYIRVQVDGHTIVEFVNGSRACSCGLERGRTPSLYPVVTGL